MSVRGYITNPRGHVWKQNGPDGVIDIFGFESGSCNGPICVNCGYGFCHHCQEEPTVDCPNPDTTLHNELVLLWSIVGPDGESDTYEAFRAICYRLGVPMSSIT